MYTERQRRNNELDDEDQLYGTPFPPLEDPNSKKQSELDQTVRDEQGRRRLHGAFTGGWSAGYYNSVGTKEGWTPAQFVSRKSERTQRKDLRPEDFMDDEDFSEFGIAPKQVKAKDEFLSSTSESFAGFRENLNRQPASSTLDDVLKDVITLRSTSIGVRILKRMKRNAIQKSISCERYLDNDRIFPLEFNESDLKSFFLNPKKNLNGLGYKSLTSNVNFSTDARLEQQSKSEFSTVMKDGKKLKISGEAFGYGALDEDDGYEAEVYSFDDLSKYDYTLGGKQKNKQSGHLLNSILSDSNLMDDFHKETQDHELNRGTKNCNVIKVPAGWKPRPPIRTSSDTKRKSRWSSEGDEENQITAERSNKYQRLDATKRSQLLGEDATSLEREEIEMKLKKVKEEQQAKSIEQQLKSADQSSKEQRPPEVFKKPLSGFFASKFIQSADTPLDALKPGLTRIEELPQAIKPPKNDDVSEETKTFVGKSDREIFQFHPHKLVCKRFNVPHPYPQFPDVVGVLAMNKPKKDPDSFFPQPTAVPSSSSRSAPVKKETVPEVIEEFKKPDMNLFKAVFDLSDDDDDDADLSDLEINEENDQTGEVKESTAAETAPISLNDQKCEETISDKSDLSPISTVNSISGDPPRIVFNKAFVKKETTKETTTVKSSKVSVNLFECEDLGSVEEGDNLLDLKKKPPQPERPSDDRLKKQEPLRDGFDKANQSIVFKRKEASKANRRNDEQIDDESSKRTLDDHHSPKKPVDESAKKDVVTIDDESGESSNVDDFISEIMKSESGSSSHKKKRKKHKEHKKHKKKKHKSDR